MTAPLSDGVAPGMSTVYVSITGLRLRGLRHLPRFWWHAVRSYRQAARAPGNLVVETRLVDGVHHTLTVWESEAAMRAFLGSGPHRAAMCVFPRLATGRTVGFEVAVGAVPAWDAIPSLWRERGREIEVDRPVCSVAGAKPV